MTIVQTTVDGRPATVAYLNDDFVPVAKAEATLVKVIWDDGSSAFLVPKVAKAFDPNQPRDDGGRWTGEGGRSGPLSAKDDHTTVSAPYTAKEREAVHDFTLGSDAGDVKSETAKLVRSAIDKTTTKAALTVYRGVGEWDRLSGLTVGSELMPNRFWSTSTDALAAELFTQGGKGGRIIIDVPKGTHAIQPFKLTDSWASLTTGDPDPRTGGEHHLRELLFAPTQRYKIKSIDEATKTIRVTATSLDKANPNHDELGRFAEGPSVAGVPEDVEIPTSRGMDSAPVLKEPAKNSFAERRGIRVGSKVSYSGTAIGGTSISGYGIVVGFCRNRLGYSGSGKGKPSQDVVMYDVRNSRFQFLEDVNVRLVRTKKMNPNHDERGRFASAPGGGAVIIPEGEDGGLKEFLSLTSQMGAKIDKYVLENGRAYRTDKDSFQGGVAHECYKNAADAVTRDDDLTYVEGYLSVYGVPIGHAWAVTKDNVVRDVTISDSKGIQGYYGVPFKTSFLMKELLRNKYYGLLTGQANPKAIMRVLEIDPKDSVS